jgi:hypothetical protein
VKAKAKATPIVTEHAHPCRSVCDEGFMCEEECPKCIQPNPVCTANCGAKCGECLDCWGFKRPCLSECGQG